MSLLQVFRGLFPRAKARRVPLVLYTRARCPLCEEMHHAIEAAGLGEGIELLSIDVDSDTELVSRYGHEVPVLEIAGAKAFVGRLDPRALALAVERAARSLPRGGSR
jgi:hypothetical protein